jgi:alpha-glucuronidase
MNDSNRNKCRPREYDCWFQDRLGLTGKEPLPHALRELFGRVRVLSGFHLAAEELLWGLKKFGLASRLESGGGTIPAEEQGIIIGAVSGINETLSLDLKVPGPEGFIIKNTGKAVIISGQDQIGCLYGVYRFLQLLALGKTGKNIETVEAPAMPVRMVNHWDNIDGSVERGYAGPSLFFKNDRPDYDPARITDYARLLASIGINRLSINNVNVRGQAKRLIAEKYLPDLAKLAAIFRPFGIRLMLSVNFAAPCLLRELDTADPLDPRVAGWWKNQTDLVYRYIPDLAGFLVKADSEGEPGPFQYGRTHADGANMLAAALAPRGGELIWRCFVYNCSQDWRDTATDRARSTYDNFMPLDGAFAENVLLQIKFGPMDFQVREPVSPLFGALKKTRHLMEWQITQEYTGHQIDLCFLPRIWEDILDFDTARGEHAVIRELLGAPGGIEGLAAVSNVGLDNNWTGHTLAQANLYGYGRLCWNPALRAAEIAAEWSGLSFGDEKITAAVTDILLRSYPACEKYSAPFGVGFMVMPALHYGPSVEGYEFSRWGTYHRADRDAIGIDRTPSGTGYTDQYSEKNAALFADKNRCPENLILFFHRLSYDHTMKNGETLLQNIYNTRFEGYEEVEAIIKIWEGLRDALDDEIYSSVLSRFQKQLANAREWRDVVNTYFYRRTGIPDARGRLIYE